MLVDVETKEVAMVLSRDCPTVFLKSQDADESNPARILGHLYAEERYRQAEMFGLKSGISTTRVKEELAVKYGFCSPESSLLMLYEREQFVEHGISPPVGHPVSLKEEEDWSNDVAASKPKLG